MRAIKFRAWSELEGKILPWSEVSDNLVYFIEGADGITLEQFTGLLDKNGKEIYEGDVVRLHCSFEGKCTATIEWYDARFLPVIHEKKVKNIHGKLVSMGEFHGYAGMHSCFSFPRYIEVIGNIHENPDLLT